MISRRVVFIIVLGALLFGFTPVNAQTAPAGGRGAGNVAKPDQQLDEDLRIVALRYAEAGRTAEIVKNTLNDAAGKPGEGAAGQATKVRIHVSFDDRTNSLLLRGPREMVQTATALVAQLDVAPQPGANQKQAPLSNEARLQKLETELLDLLSEIKALREEMHLTPAPRGERAK